MAKKKQSYSEAIARIEEIVDIVENKSPDIDELSDLVKEGALLIKLCKEKLRNTESALTESLDQLEANY